MARKPAPAKAKEPKASPDESQRGIAPILDELNSARTDAAIESFRDSTVRDLVQDCERLLRCIAGFDMVFLMSPDAACKQRHLLDDKWFDGFHATLERVCLAATERQVDLACWRKLTAAAYSFWRGLSSIDDTRAALVALFEPGTAELFNLKRALMVQCAKPAQTPTVSVPPELLQRLEAGIAEVGSIGSNFDAGMARVGRVIESLDARDDVDKSAAKLPELKARDTEAWQASLVAGMTQAKIADLLNQQYPGENWTQPRVSEAIKRAKAHAEASGLADKVSAARSRAPARTLDPAAADDGQRTDGRAKHLREKARQIAKEE